MNKLVLSCKRVTELVEKKAEMNLGMKKELQIFMHTRFCEGCYVYKKQSKLIDEALKVIIADGFSKLNKSDNRLSPAVKNDIIRKIKSS